MKRLVIMPKGSRCSVVIGSGASSLAAIDASKKPLGSRYCIVADSNTGRLFANDLLKGFRKRGIQADVIIFPAGEQHKNMGTVSNICERMAQRGFGRDTAVVSLGGGISGDVAGFVASIYCRGVPLVHVPTTLLAMVDSSIGGKCGVDLMAGKNLVGSIYQPRKVYMDMQFIRNLPTAQLQNGLSEVIKYGAIASPALLRLVENNITSIMARGPVIEKIVGLCCQIKKSVVERDVLEANLRMVLNFGHTIGHALEKLSHYRLSHGQAVASGMIAEAEISRSLGFLSNAELSRLRSAVSAAGLPVVIPHFDSNSIFEASKSDKKARHGIPRFVLLEGLGRVRSDKGAYAFEVGKDVVMEALEKCRKGSGV